MAAAKQPSPLSNGETLSCRYYCPLHSTNTKKNHLAAPAVQGGPSNEPMGIVARNGECGINMAAAEKVRYKLWQRRCLVCN